jgi:hypothetical protein
MWDGAEQQFNLTADEARQQYADPAPYSEGRPGLAREPVRVSEGYCAIRACQSKEIRPSRTTPLVGAPDSFAGLGGPSAAAETHRRHVRRTGVTAGRRGLPSEARLPYFGVIRL